MRGIKKPLYLMRAILTKKYRIPFMKASFLRALVLISLLFATPALAGSQDKFIAGAIAQTEAPGVYDGRYFNIPYPGGDVPQGRGVCSDVVIRAYRAAGIDLQKLVHDDMKKNFSAYPKLWGLKAADTNIDHRRVPNLAVFFTRFGRKLPVTKNAADYHAGDMVIWNLRQDGGSLPHIGIVTDRKGVGGRPLMAHNIGQGPKLEDMLFDYTITGHYRYGLD